MRTPEEYKKLIEDPLWRINNLYYITNKQGQRVRFELNWAQKELYDNMWYLNVILKARQLGMSTFVCLLFLDRCLFNSHKSAGIIAHTVEDAQHMFRRVKFAYDNLPERLRRHITCDNDTAQMLKFSNGSSLRVGTSLRSSTFQYLHISEFGKICAKYPEKAEEIISGSLNTVEAGQYVFIESTAEGREGYFYEMCKTAQNNKHKKLGKLDFRFHFFPWYKEPSYSIGNTLSMDNDLLDYFNFLAGKGIKLEDSQKNWYASKHAVQQENMLREFPSTPEEAWQQSNEGTYYGKLMTTARLEGRIGFVPHDPELLVNTAWDLGYNDSTAIWFFQVYGKEIRLIDYEEGSGESLAHWLSVVKKKDYTYNKHLAPHDIMVKEYSTGQSRQRMAQEMGMTLIPVPKTEIIAGIDKVRSIIPRIWVDEKKCAQGIKCLENYKKEWDDKHGCWRSSPLHNWASHCFTGETKVLTRNGTHRIIDLPEKGEVLTLCGWKEYKNPRITRVNAPLVEVRFKGGYTVKCTPDHMFLTAKGWKSAEFLEMGLQIQSSLTHSLNISMEGYIDYGLKKLTSHVEVKNFIEKFGKTPLVKYLKNVTYITKTLTQGIIIFPIWNVCQNQNIKGYHAKVENLLHPFLIKQDIKQQNGIDLKKVDYGIKDMLKEQRHGLNGKEKKKTVRSVVNYLIVLLEKMVIRKNIAQTNAKPLIIEGVKHLQEVEDVWCITVPEIEHFSLSNGAVVHNCSDAFRTIACGLHFVMDTKVKDTHNPVEYMANRFRSNF